MAFTATSALPRWFGPEQRPLHGYLHLPDRATRTGVVLCPPIGYESWCSYSTYRELAVRLADAGAAVLRFDYDGTHDSAGHYTDPDRVPAWEQSIRVAIGELADAGPKMEGGGFTPTTGIDRVILVGMRVGATLAFLAADERVTELVLWDPVVSGRRFVREIKALSMAGEAADPDVADDGALASAGTVHTAETVAGLGKLDLMTAPPPRARIHVIERDDRPGAGKLVERLRAAGSDVDARSMPGTGGILDVAVEHGTLPTAILDAIVELVTNVIASAPATGMPTFAERASEARIEWDGMHVLETPIRTANRKLFGILGRPAAADRTPDTLVLFGSSGTEHHTGPGRIWVEFARAMNAHGLATLRVDFDGIGESPVAGPSRVLTTYDLEHVTDVRELVAFAHDRGYRDVVVLGLCSSAWMAIHAGIEDPTIAAVIAVNPQLYWKPGDPIDILIAESQARRAPEWKREEELRRYHVWSILDLIGVRPPAGRWLDRLVAREVPTLLAFAERDLGLTYLERRCGRRLRQLLGAGPLSLVEVAGIDHPMHRYRKRPEMLRAFLTFIDNQRLRPASERRRSSIVEVR